MALSIRAYTLGGNNYIGANVNVYTSVPSNTTREDVHWEFGSQSGTLVRLGTSSTLPYELSTPLTFYYEIPRSTYGVLSIYLDAYDGDTLIGSTYTTLTLYANESFVKPSIMLPSVKSVDELTEYLTGNGDETLIRYVSTANFKVSASAYWGAELVEVKVWCGGRQYFAGAEGLVPNIDSDSFKVEAHDSRGYVTTINYTVPAERFVSYTKLTCNAGNEKPDTHGDMRLTCSGNFFNQSFGAEENTLQVEYRYKENNGEYTEWAEMVRSAANPYTAYADITGLNYQSTYLFECRATDQAMTITSAEYVTRSIPVFHWSADDFVHETPVDFRAGISFNGVESDYIVEQGESGIWQYRKWNSGLAECWGRKTVTVYESSWSSYGGSLYEAELLTGEYYPFTFTEINCDIATLHSFAGGLLSSVISSSLYRTGTYYVIHPVKLDDFDYSLSLFVRGRWK